MTPSSESMRNSSRRFLTYPRVTILPARVPSMMTPRGMKQFKRHFENFLRLRAFTHRTIMERGVDVRPSVHRQREELIRQKTTVRKILRPDDPHPAQPQDIVAKNFEKTIARESPSTA